MVTSIGARLLLAGAACLTWVGCAGTVKDSGAGGAAGGSASGGSSGGTAGHTGTGGGVVIINSTGGKTGSGGATGAGGATSGSGGAASGAGWHDRPRRCAGLGGVAGTCSLFTPDDAWNTDVSAKAVDTANTTKVNALLGAVNIHPDFGSDFGIPFNTVPANQPALPITFSAYADESDPGPYPFPPPATANIEGGSPTSCGGDCHMIAVQLGTCQLYEGYGCNDSSGWTCANGAHWDLTKKSQGQRPDGWTSADAAGLPIYAGLARYAEYQAGADHPRDPLHPALHDQHAWSPPATHEAVPGGGADQPNAPPMGLRIRLKASFDISELLADRADLPQGVQEVRHDPRRQRRPSRARSIFQSEQNSELVDDEINDLKRVPVSAFEAVCPRRR